MFYCDPCAQKYGWPMTLRQSHGKCEMCEDTTLCNDIPSRLLPDKPKAEEKNDE